MALRAPPGPGEAVGSPCVNVCRLDPVSGYCLGCWRDLDEIAAWSRLDAAARRAIWLQLPARERAGAPDPAAGEHR
ncbi:MAG TPA: DUF1289 domain-containing protein [Burkholderiaceae bacterium]|nr:DUF1289 domain-containing protein [Burkholderiaceae bacterium]HMX10818.1 DUF1289 domain-containing protein [Burkholderiaceae bacterium]HMZ01590.1 DUF1289 domain-containing protein [Burkholderiaceae bacterium]HNB44721.1 DUF1289 domain-containing protein [Burkholderiaceae bacterium]HNG81855.1 DUF1289 domain-containing protein [Burkholderiaceae bacterium]